MAVLRWSTIALQARPTSNVTFSAKVAAMQAQAQSMAGGRVARTRMAMRAPFCSGEQWLRAATSQRTTGAMAQMP